MSRVYPSKIEENELRRRWEAGEAQAEIARFFKCTPTAISRAVDRLGLPRRPPPPGAPKKGHRQTMRKKTAAQLRGELRRQNEERERIDHAVERLPGRDRWPEEVDRAIVEAGRSYAAQAKVEERFELAPGSAWRRWVVIKPLVERWGE